MTVVVDALGFSARPASTSSTVPEIGAKISETALTDSTEPTCWPFFTTFRPSGVEEHDVPQLLLGVVGHAHAAGRHVDRLGRWVPAGFRIHRSPLWTLVERQRCDACPCAAAMNIHVEVDPRLRVRIGRYARPIAFLKCGVSAPLVTTPLSHRRRRRRIPVRRRRRPLSRADRRRDSPSPSSPRGWPSAEIALSEATIDSRPSSRTVVVRRRRRCSPASRPRGAACEARPGRPGRRWRHPPPAESPARP